MIKFEDEFPEAAAVLMKLYARYPKRFFEAPWLHFFSNGTYNNIPYGR